VDWFLPIQEYLQGLTALNGLRLVESYKTIFIEVVEIVQTYDTPVIPHVYPTAINEFPPFTFPCASGVGSSGYLQNMDFTYNFYRKTVICKREVIPLPDVPTPRFKNPFSLDHLLNAIALLTK
jgi:hypothetical protein